MCILDLASCSYLFSYPKCKAEHVSKAYTVRNIYFLTQNMKRDMYIRSDQLYIDFGYLFSQPKYWSQ